MGIKNFWSLVEPCGHNISIESLRGKRLAVDISIWLNQIVRAARTKNGEAIENSHIHIVISRLCKLLYYGIKPIIVFDGDAPALKKRTLAHRREVAQKAAKHMDEIRSELIITELADKLKSNDKETPTLLTAQVKPIESDSESSNDEIVVNNVEEELSALYADHPSEKDPIYIDIPYKSEMHHIAVNTPQLLEVPKQLRPRVISLLRAKLQRNTLAMLQRYEGDPKELSIHQVEANRYKAKVLKDVYAILQTNYEEEQTKQNQTNINGYESSFTENTTSIFDINTVTKSTKTPFEIEFKNDVMDSFDLKRQRMNNEFFHSIDYHHQNMSLIDDNDNDENKDNSFIYTHLSDFLSVDDPTIKNYNNDILLHNDEKEELMKLMTMVIANFSDDEMKQDDVNVKQEKEDLNYILKQESKQETEQESKHEVKQETKQESKHEVKQESKHEGENVYNVKQNTTQNEIKYEENKESKQKGTYKETEKLQNEIKHIKNEKTTNSTLSTSYEKHHDIILPSHNSSHSGLLTFDDILLKDNTDLIFEVEQNGTFIVSKENSRIPPSPTIHSNRNSFVTPSNSMASPSNLITSFNQVQMESVPSQQQSMMSIASSQQLTSIISPQSSQQQPTSISPPQQQPFSISSPQSSPSPHQHESPSPSHPSLLITPTLIPTVLPPPSLPDISEEKINEIMTSSSNQLQQRKQDLLQRYRHFSSQNSFVSEDIIMDIVEILHIFGIPYIFAPGEAEAQCSFLEMMNLIDGIISNDSDIFAFGGKTVYRNFFLDNHYVEAYKSNDLEKELGLTRERIILYSLLEGCDYCEGIQGIGKVLGIEIISFFSSFEQMRNANTIITKVDNKDNDITISKECRDFINQHKEQLKQFKLETIPNPVIINAFMFPAIDMSLEPFQWGEVNMKELKEFCEQQHHMDFNCIRRMVDPAIHNNHKEKQQKITDYLTYANNCKICKEKSIRIQKAIQRLLAH